MTVIVRKNASVSAVIREAESLVPKTIIGVRVKRLLVRIDEKRFDGVSGTFLSGNGGAVEKLLFLFGKSGVNILPYKGGSMEICIS